MASCFLFRITMPSIMEVMKNATTAPPMIPPIRYFLRDLASSLTTPSGGPGVVISWSVPVTMDCEVILLMPRMTNAEVGVRMGTGVSGTKIK